VAPETVDQLKTAVDEVIPRTTELEGVPQDSEEREARFDLPVAEKAGVIWRSVNKIIPKSVTPFLREIVALIIVPVIYQHSEGFAEPPLDPFCKPRQTSVSEGLNLIESK
jgi:hypothetical protein